MTRLRRLCLTVAAWLTCVSCTFTASGPTLAAEIALSCQSVESIEKRTADLICKEFFTAFQRSYPRSAIMEASPERPAQAEVTIVNATSRGLGLQLAWIGADGKKLIGETKSVTVMDRELDASRRSSLYQRLIATTPKPE